MIHRTVLSELLGVLVTVPNLQLEIPGLASTGKPVVVSQSITEQVCITVTL